MIGKLEWRKAMRDQWKLETSKNARRMEIKITKQCVINGNENDWNNAW